MNVITKNINEVELTSTLCGIVDFNEILDLSNKENTILYTELRLGEGEYYTRISDWMRLVNKLNRYDCKPLKRFMMGDKEIYEYSKGVFIKHIQFNEYELIFKDPVKVAINIIGDDVILTDAKKLFFELTWDWFYSNRNSLTICDILEVNFSNIKIIN